jgi:hypothetical protein
MNIIGFLGSSTVQLHDSLGSRCAYAHVQRLVSIVKMAPVLEECAGLCCEFCMGKRALCKDKLQKKKLCGFSPQANYANRATAAFRRS